MFIALREETVGLRGSPMFSLAVDISLLWSKVVSITHPSYKHFDRSAVRTKTTFINTLLPHDVKICGLCCTVKLIYNPR